MNLQIKLFLSLIEFAKHYNFVNNKDDIILYIPDKNALNELNSLKKLIIEELKNFKEIESTFEINNNNLFKIALQYDVEMIKLKNTYIKENNISFDYLFLGPDYLVSSTQPALGMVYKLMEINSIPCIKFSEEKDKQTIPGSKSIYRLFDSHNKLIGDYLSLVHENENLNDKKEIEALYNNF